MNGLVVTLDPHERRVAEHIGRARAKLAAERGDSPRFAFRDPGENARNHVNGALAECAAAKGLGIYWNMGIDTFRKTPDLGSFERGTDVEVRWSLRSDLKIIDADADTTRVVLVNGGPSRFVMRGWFTAAAGKDPSWLSSPAPGRPAYFVPGEMLWPIDALIERLSECLR